jgi:serine phosphatase RsbU (regulator of sigma subunit)
LSELVSVAQLASAKTNFACDRICDEYAREAKLIQSSLLPTLGLRHESVEIAFRFMPFSDVGGDFADVFGLPDGSVSIYLGDVVGKGLPAAMYGALAMGTLRGIHKTGTDTARVLAQLNERLVQRPIRGRFCSTLYALFDPATRELIFSNAGMPLPILISATGYRHLGEGGLPSGMFPGATYDRQSCSSAPETAFCLRPTVSMNCATGRESSSAPRKWRRFGHNADKNRQPNRWILSLTTSWPSPMAARRTTILLWWC